MMFDAPYYLSSKEIAEACGYTRASFSLTLARWGPESEDPFPQPDVVVARSPGWDTGRLDEIHNWTRRHTRASWRKFRRGNWMSSVEKGEE